MAPIEPPATNALPTRAELAARVRAFQLAVRRPALGIMALMVALVFVGMPAMMRWALQHGLRGAAMVVPLVTMLGLACALDLVNARLARRHGVTCPACRRPLGRQTHIAVAGGRCGQCGGAVARDDVPAADWS